MPVLPWARVAERVHSALARLMEGDGYLLESNAHERTVAAKLACYLAEQFPGYAVDVEYNRHGLNPKTAELPALCRGGGRRKVVPDIVIHQRGTDESNLVVVELKKESNPEARSCDHAKLVALQRERHYAYGVFIELPAGRGASMRSPRVQRVHRSGRITMQ